MSKTSPAPSPPPPWPAGHPLVFLTVSFVLYRAFLLLVALGTAPLAEYDTSTAIFLALPGRADPNATAQPPLVARKLLKWDAIYFTHVAREGYVFEQEWAFGLGFPAVVGAVVKALREYVGVRTDEVLVGVAVAHAAHLAAVLSLYQLTLVLLAPHEARPTRALVPALLHVVSPAGIFLSAPYAESSCAALSFLGTLLFALSHTRPTGSPWRVLWAVSSGIVLGAAVAFRSNGVLSGLLFLAEVGAGLVDWWNAAKTRGVLGKRAVMGVVDVAAYGLGGLGVAVGFFGPQVLAWKRYCNDVEARRPWCDDTPPNIYMFVQGTYWNVGFLQYWTPNQIPLFCLAGPMLWLLVTSGISTMRDPSAVASRRPTPSSDPSDKTERDPEASGRMRRTVRVLAGTQTLLACLAITNYHVQIINRISSGYPVWYWWVTARLGDHRAGQRKLGRAVVAAAVVYGTVQAGLFASFMPPA